MLGYTETIILVAGSLAIVFIWKLFQIMFRLADRPKQDLKHSVRRSLQSSINSGYFLCFTLSDSLQGLDVAKCRNRPPPQPDFSRG